MKLNIIDIEKRLKHDTNNLYDIIYRKKVINHNKVLIMFNEPLTDSNKISDFIIRSLNNLNARDILLSIENNINNFKWIKITNYEDICKYIHKGFTIIIVDNKEYGFALETKANLSRSITYPEGENTLRGAKDSFVEEYQTNIGLIKKRIKTNELWINTVNIGEYTDALLGILSINSLVDENLLNEVTKKIENIKIEGVFNLGTIKNAIGNEKRSVFPIIKTTERPDVVAKYLLDGKIAIIMDNTPFALVLPTTLNDYFKTMEDVYGNYKNVSFTRLVKYLAFFISLLAPAIYVSLITYNMEIVPTSLLINIANQRDGVPFPVPIEAFIMLISFEILRESDLRASMFTGSSLSIVGALILGEAAVSAGIVSPITIIVIALTAISSILFTELDLINALRWYRLFFLVGATFMGLIGVIVVFLFLIINLSAIKSFNKPYLMPFAPFDKQGIKDSIFKAKERTTT